MNLNLQSACDILELDLDFTRESLKKKYHKMALQYHPDKNGNTIDANEKFKIINESYTYLNDILEEDSDSNSDFNSTAFSSFDFDLNSENNNTNQGYIGLLQVFIQSIIKGNYTKVVSTIITDIVSGCKKVTIKLFEELDKERSIEIYTFLTRYKSILYVSQDTIDEVKAVLLEKLKDDQIIILNPSIDDLFECNIYKLSLNGHIYLVPLWHNELYFDSVDGGEIIVKCIPDLHANMWLDENNNLFVKYQIPFSSLLLKSETFLVVIGRQTFEIDVSKLYIKQNQQYILKKKGIAQTVNDNNDICNVSLKADIILKIEFI